MEVSGEMSNGIVKGLVPRKATALSTWKMDRRYSSTTVLSTAMASLTGAGRGSPPEVAQGPGLQAAKVLRRYERTQLS